MINKLTATLTATRSTISPSTKIITHGSTPDRDLCGSLRTHRMDLRIRRLGVRIPSGAPVFPLVNTLFFVFSQHPLPVPVGSGSHLLGAIQRQQRLGHPSGSRPFLALHEMPVHIFSDGDAGVSENLGDHVEISALGQHQ
jgi:hypothetical protein